MLQSNEEWIGSLLLYTEYNFMAWPFPSSDITVKFFLPKQMKQTWGFYIPNQQRAPGTPKPPSVWIFNIQPKPFNIQRKPFMSHQKSQLCTASSTIGLRQIAGASARTRNCQLGICRPTLCLRASPVDIIGYDSLGTQSDSRQALTQNMCHSYMLDTKLGRRLSSRMTSSRLEQKTAQTSSACSVFVAEIKENMV